MNEPTNLDTLKSLGRLLAPGEGVRDAVHIAVIPAVAGATLTAGDRVVLVDGKAFNAPTAAYVGIVDPFLTGFAQPGDRFWLWLEPGSITSLRHDWTHPAFPAEAEPPAVGSDEKAASERWLRAQCEDSGFPYRQVLQAAMYGDELTVGYDANMSADEEFWRHVEIITGRKYDPEHREKVYFGCAC